MTCNAHNTICYCTLKEALTSVADPPGSETFLHIRIWIGNDLTSRIWKYLTRRIRIVNYHRGLGLLEEKCSDKNTIFGMES